MKTNQARKLTEQAFGELAEAVEAGRSEKLIAYLKAMGRFHRYSLGNILLISLQKPDASHVAGFRGWQRLRRHVKKGERGIAILAPIIRHRKIIETDEQEKPGKEIEEEVAIAFKTAYVFDVSQTSGKPLAEFASVHGDPGCYSNRLKKYILDQGIRVEYSHSIGAADGVSSGGFIRLRHGLSAAEEFSVLVHELAHEILHKDRDSMANDKKLRETQAEAVAFVVSHAIRLDSKAASSDYIQLYHGDKKTLLESLGQIQKAAAEILTAIMADDNSECETTSREPCPAIAA